MPTSKIRNAVYRALLPFCAPDSGLHPVSGVSGHDLVRMHDFSKLIRRHHILGSVTLLESEDQYSLICTSSSDPPHNAEPDTFFRVASITKTATAVLVMHLAEKKVISVKEPVSHYLPAASCMNSITLEHLLSHRSGIIDPPDLESSLLKGIPFTDILPSALRFMPDESFQYSNFGYGLIGCILEAVFNRPIGMIYQDYLFGPLQMNATLEGCLLPTDRIMPVTRILPYRRGNDLMITPLGSVHLKQPDPLRHYGHTAGSMYTDVCSLQKLLHVLFRKKSEFLSDSACEEMKREHSSYGKLSPTLSYGLGILRINDRSVTEGMIYGHQGFAYGCADGAFFEENTGRIMITLNGGCSEARTGRLGLANRDFLRWAFRKELPSW